MRPSPPKSPASPKPPQPPLSPPQGPDAGGQQGGKGGRGRGSGRAGGALTRHSQAAEVVGVAAERGRVPTAPAAPGALAVGEVLELVGLAQVGPAVQAAEQHLGGQRLLGPPRVPPWHPDAAGLPGAPALHRLHQQLQLLVLQLLEQGMCCGFQGAVAVLGAGRRAALPPEPPHQRGTTRAEHGAAATSWRTGTGVTRCAAPGPPLLPQGQCCAPGGCPIRPPAGPSALGAAVPCVALCQVPRLTWGCDPQPPKKSPVQGRLPAPRQGSPLGKESRGKGSDSRWAAELGARSRGCAWGCALGAARTALPAARRSQDFFLCRDSLLPRTSPFGKFIDSWRPGLGLSCGRGQDVAAAGQAPDAWAVVGRDAPLPAGLPEPGCLPRLSGTARGGGEEPGGHRAPRRHMAAREGPCWHSPGHVGRAGKRGSSGAQHHGTVCKPPTLPAATRRGRRDGLSPPRQGSPLPPRSPRLSLQPGPPAGTPRGWEPAPQQSS